jgi:hypothetical protein
LNCDVGPDEAHAARVCSDLFRASRPPRAGALSYGFGLPAPAPPSPTALTSFAKASEVSVAYWRRRLATSAAVAKSSLSRSMAPSAITLQLSDGWALGSAGL